MALRCTSSTSARAITGQRLAVPRVAVSTRTSRRAAAVQVKALMTPPGGKDKKGGLSRDDEPEEYWSSKSERAGANPFKDPVAIIGIVAILFPFLFVLIAIATGAIDTSVYR